MPVKIVVLIVSSFMLCSCAKNTSYIRYTDLHHVELQRLKLDKVNKDSVMVSFCRSKLDTCNAKQYGFRISDVRFEYLEGKRVIRIDSSYYIKARIKNKRIKETYYNRDVNFLVISISFYLKS